MTKHAAPLTFNSYQKVAMATTVPEDWQPIVYPVLGLNGEVGEVTEKVKKIQRDKAGKPTPTDLLEIAKELGDVLWYLAAISQDIGYSLEEIAYMNKDKILSRRKRNKVSGSGDNR